MDASIQRALLLRGLAVTAGAEGSNIGGADVVVRYVDDWGWDLAMYLKRLELLVYDARTNALVASATWKNSALHGFHSVDKVVASLVAETLGELR
jgi:hypothetical protein